jgi:hypothetical protein
VGCERLLQPDPRLRVAIHARIHEERPSRVARPRRDGKEVLRRRRLDRLDAEAAGHTGEVDVVEAHRLDVVTERRVVLILGAGAGVVVDQDEDGQTCTSQRLEVAER